MGAARAAGACMRARASRLGVVVARKRAGGDRETLLRLQRGGRHADVAV